MPESTSCFSTLWNWVSIRVTFSMAALFISGLICSKSFLEIAFKAFLIWYIEQSWVKQSIRKAAAFANAFEGVILFSSIVAHHKARDRIGHFRLLTITVLCLILGLLMLWLYSLLLSPDRRNQLLYLGLWLLSIGIAGENASLKSFLIDQFYIPMEENRQQQILDPEEEDIAEDRADFWFHAAGFLGMFTSWAFASSLNWNHTFMVTFIVVTVAYLTFCCGICYYKHIRLSNKTAASRMMQAKRLLKLIPLCLTFIPYSLVEASGNTLFVVQSYRLDSGINPRIPVDSFNRIPITSLYVFYTLISSIISMSSDFLIKKRWRNEEAMQHARFVRIGIGMLFAIGSCLSAWLVEVRKLKLINKLGITDNQQVIPMKILWLAPQFGLLGIANGLAAKGMWHFFSDRVPQSMRFFAYPLTLAVLCFGRFLSATSVLLARHWIRDTVNKSHLDKYFRMLTILNSAVLVVYIILSCLCDWNIAEAHIESETPKEEVDDD